jgi:hypothetical protein
LGASCNHPSGDAKDTPEYENHQPYGPGKSPNVPLVSLQEVKQAVGPNGKGNNEDDPREPEDNHVVHKPSMRSTLSVSHWPKIEPLRVWYSPMTAVSTSHCTFGNVPTLTPENTWLARNGLRDQRLGWRGLQPRSMAGHRWSSGRQPVRSRWDRPAVPSPSSSELAAIVQAAVKDRNGTVLEASTARRLADGQATAALRTAGSSTASPFPCRGRLADVRRRRRHSMFRGAR